MARNKWMDQLCKFDDAVTDHSNNIYANGLPFPTPSLGWTLAKTHRVPRGYTVIYWGPAKGGKSLILNAQIGKIHADDPEAIVVKFNTEFREQGQMTPQVMKWWGIDPDRYIAYETNLPESIFDRIQGPIAKMCEEGAPIRAIVIDSITEVLGRKQLNAESVSDFQMGDKAQTLEAGLSRCRSVLRKYGITLLLSAQVRAEFDQLEVKRGKKNKMAGAWFLKHYAEYYIYVERDDRAAAKKSLDGSVLAGSATQDLGAQVDKQAQKIRFCLNESSCGVSGRWGQATFDFNRGFINQHEEIFLLGKQSGVLERINNLTWGFEGQTWKGEKNMLEAVRDNPELQEKIMKAVRLRDIDAMERGEVASVPGTYLDGTADEAEGDEEASAQEE